MASEDYNSFYDFVDPGEASSILPDISLLREEDNEIDLQALADEVYALMVKELKLEMQRLGQRR